MFTFHMIAHPEGRSLLVVILPPEDVLAILDSKPFWLPLQWMLDKMPGEYHNPDILICAEADRERVDAFLLANDATGLVAFLRRGTTGVTKIPRPSIN